MKVFLTGVAGFIGYHVAKRLIDERFEVVAIDNINEYYDTRLKYGRLEKLGIDGKKETDTNGLLEFHKLDLTDMKGLTKLFEGHKFNFVINLAAQAGVRYQFENPQAYVDSNLQGFVNIMEVVRNHPVDHFVYASSSSVYGLNESAIFQETDEVDHPASLYSATKRANELIAHSYSNTFGIPSTGLRFFTVYGPWGRPDMFMYKLANSITTGEQITIYQRNGENLWRDYTYIDDIVEGIFRIMKHIPTPDGIDRPNSSSAPFAVYNIGRGEPVDNGQVITTMETYFGKEANKKIMDAPPTEIYKTFASTKLLEEAIGYRPKVSVQEGLQKFVDWYKEFWGV